MSTLLKYSCVAAISPFDPNEVMLNLFIQEDDQHKLSNVFYRKVEVLFPVGEGYNTLDKNSLLPVVNSGRWQASVLEKEHFEGQDWAKFVFNDLKQGLVGIDEVASSPLFGVVIDQSKKVGKPLADIAITIREESKTGGSDFELRETKIPLFVKDLTAQIKWAITRTNNEASGPKATFTAGEGIQVAWKTNENVEDFKIYYNGVSHHIENGHSVYVIEQGFQTSTTIILEAKGKHLKDYDYQVLPIHVNDNLDVNGPVKVSGENAALRVLRGLGEKKPNYIDFGNDASFIFRSMKSDYGDAETRMEFVYETDGFKRLEISDDLAAKKDFVVDGELKAQKKASFDNGIDVEGQIYGGELLHLKNNAHLHMNIILGKNEKGKRFILSSSPKTDQNYFQIAAEMPNGDWDWDKGLRISRAGDTEILGDLSVNNSLKVSGGAHIEGGIDVNEGRVIRVKGSEDYDFHDTKFTTAGLGWHRSGNEHEGSGTSAYLAAWAGIRLMVAGECRMFIRQSGETYIGGSLHEEGDSGVWVSSDTSLKKDVEGLKSSLDKIHDLKGVYFSWNEKGLQKHLKGVQLLYDEGNKREEKEASLRKKYGVRQIGLIAQDVEVQFPELVQTDDDGDKEVNYGALNAVLLEAIKELKSEKDNELAELKQKHQIEINDLKSRISNLEAKLEAIIHVH